MRFDWLTTTAVAAVLASGVVLAQAQGPQKRPDQATPSAEHGATNQPSAQHGQRAQERGQSREGPGGAQEKGSRAAKAQEHQQERGKQPRQAQQPDQGRRQNQAQQPDQQRPQNQAQEQKQQRQEPGKTNARHAQEQQIGRASCRERV